MNWYRFIHYPNKYYSWWGFDTLPATNQNSTFVDFICDEVIPKWINLGASGYRLDVVDELNSEFVERISTAVPSGSETLYSPPFLGETPCYAAIIMAFCQDVKHNFEFS